jgi:hypothetical protein
MAIWHILWSFGYIFPRFGLFYQEKFGNPEVKYALQAEAQHLNHFDCVRLCGRRFYISAKMSGFL